MDDPTLCCCASGGYWDRCDLILGVDGLHVTGVERDDGGRLVVTVESESTVMGCPACGVLARHGRDEVVLVDAPAFGRPVRIRWRKRRWVCPDPGCPADPVHDAFSRRSCSIAHRHTRVVNDERGAATLSSCYTKVLTGLFSDRPGRPTNLARPAAYLHPVADGCLLVTAAPIIDLAPSMTQRTSY